MPEPDLTRTDDPAVVAAAEAWMNDLLADPLPPELQEDAGLLRGKIDHPGDVRAVDALRAAGDRVDATVEQECGIDPN